ncbi:SPP1 phage holin family protein [Anaerofustis stercorihominis]|uniref:Holin, SPP1 family n=1 Tax=Anaerofustis stercorihominis DSM 17244 TaxID=445971 RepID=B1C5V3_9FIRM|nr:SPP1 phage holin family protein [Anaerofustis stercorihominis]EDS73522.1 putative holin, SPP1 family [Anaerofustis stercorihominis DSM 17244]MCQ4794670.1 SPP1 phage holin family protein [Anaerofustis stercorihominis]
MKKIDLKGITADTIARMIFLLVSMINGAAAMFGFTKLDIDENTIYTVVTGVSVIVSAVIGFWKNNSFTSAAIEGDNLKNALKSGDVTKEDLKAVEEAEEDDMDYFLSEEELKEMDMD